MASTDAILNFSSCGSREQGRFAQEFYTTVKTTYTFA
jgi:hypothetical protein